MGASIQVAYSHDRDVNGVSLERHLDLAAECNRLLQHERELLFIQVYTNYREMEPREFELWLRRQ